jgi:hypothetical protein
MTKPKLTRAQRFQFDALGYVLLRGVLTADEVASCKTALYRMKSDPDLDATDVYRRLTGEHRVLMGNLVAYDPALLGFATHPKLIPLVEEVVGGHVRLEETEAIINSRDPEDSDALLDGKRVHPTGFHRGTTATWGCYYEQERFHCVFVKTLAYLTDVGPDDGGTAMIPGSHRMNWPQEEMVAAAAEDAGLVYQVEASAGDVLLFPESLIHSTTRIKSEGERVILVSGYTPPMIREWPGNEVKPEFVANLPEDIQPIVSGSESWHWKRNYPASPDPAGAQGLPGAEER